MARLRWVLVQPVSGPTDAPWLPFPAGDALARAAAPVCQAYTRALAAADLQAPVSRIHLMLEPPLSRPPLHQENAPAEDPWAADEDSGPIRVPLRLLPGRRLGPELVLLTLPPAVAQLASPALTRLALDAVHTGAGQVLSPGQEPDVLEAVRNRVLEQFPDLSQDDHGRAEPLAVLRILNPPPPSLTATGIVFIGHLELGKWPQAAPWRRELNRLMKAVVRSQNWQDWWTPAPQPRLELTWSFDPRLFRDEQVLKVRRHPDKVTARVHRTVHTLSRDGVDLVELARADLLALMDIVAASVGLPAPPPLPNR